MKYKYKIIDGEITIHAKRGGIIQINAAEFLHRASKSDISMRNIALHYGVSDFIASTIWTQLATNEQRDAKIKQSIERKKRGVYTVSEDLTPDELERRKRVEISRRRDSDVLLQREPMVYRIGRMQ